MTSINTNVAAVTALRTLQSTNTALDATQARISTGLRIGEAKDNAAYWSIATTLKSDNKSLGTVKDALGMGAATVDVAYESLNAALDVLNEIQTKLTAATQDGVDKGAIQAEIAALQKQLESIAKSATFSGENWLAIDSTAVGYEGTKRVVASFVRDINDVISIGTIDINAGEVALIDGTSNNGILQKKSYIATSASAVGSAAIYDHSGDTLTFTLTLGSGSAQNIVINQARVNAVGDKDDVLDSLDEMAAIINTAISENASLAGRVLAKVSGGNIVYEADETLAISAATGAGNLGTNTNVANGTMTAIAIGANTRGTDTVVNFDITAKSKDDIKRLIAKVSTAADAVTTAASKLGAVAKRIELQQSFAANLMDTIDKGVSGLVDADMNEESTRLQALQVKQQLGVQALSIANQSAQNILRLFQ